jgi:hypothetical protein
VAFKHGADQTAGLCNRPVEHGAQVQRLPCGVGICHIAIPESFRTEVHITTPNKKRSSKKSGSRRYGQFRGIVIR